MTRHDYFLLGALVLSGALCFFTPAKAATSREPGNSCVYCHSRLPETSFVGVKSHSWKGSIHQAHGVTCDKCHGGNPRGAEKKIAHEGLFGSSNPHSPVYYKRIPSTCGKCHGAEYYKFTQSLHYKMLESTGKGPDCVTCHGSMVTGILTPDTIAAVCARCHNGRMGVFPYVPQKAKAVLLLLRESEALLDAEKKLYRPVRGSDRARAMNEAGTAVDSARLDWHKFDLDAITGHLQKFYDAVLSSHKPGERGNPDMRKSK